MWSNSKTSVYDSSIEAFTVHVKHYSWAILSLFLQLWARDLFLLKQTDVNVFYSLYKDHIKTLTFFFTIPFLLLFKFLFLMDFVTLCLSNLDYYMLKVWSSWQRQKPSQYLMSEKLFTSIFKYDDYTKCMRCDELWNS